MHRYRRLLEDSIEYPKEAGRELADFFWANATKCIIDNIAFPAQRPPPRSPIYYAMNSRGTVRYYNAKAGLGLIIIFIDIGAPLCVLLPKKEKMAESDIGWFRFTTRIMQMRLNWNI